MSNPIADFPWDYKHVTGSMQVMSHPGALHTIVINGVTEVGDITIWDNPAATGNVIGIIHLTTTLARCLQYDCHCKTGLYIEYDQAVDADLTVNYK